jgi:Holliday junction resolvase
MASRINTTGIWDQRLGKYRPTTMKRGLADIWATYQGKSLQIEVKIRADQMSEHQMKVQKQQEQAGGWYYVARDFSSFKEWFDNL